MHIAQVIPLTLLPQNVPQILSYLCPKELPKGAVIEILIRNRKTKAIVIQTNSIEEQKQILRKSAFQLKKINKIISPILLVNDAQFRLALWLSKYYYAPLGLCLKSVLPSFFLDKNYTAPNSNLEDPIEIKPEFIITRAKNVLNKLEHVISLAVKNSGQALIILPEDSVIDYYFQNLRSQYKTVLYHGALNKKEMRAAWQAIEHGKVELIIGTRQAILAPYKKLRLVVIEDPANEAYKSDMTPKYNTPAFAQYLAQLHHAQYLIVSHIPDIEHYSPAHWSKYTQSDAGASLSTDIALVNALDEVKTDNFSLLSRSLQNQIKLYTEKKKKILILSSRKGYSGILICQNCGLTAKCPNCSIPMRVHKIPEPLLICYHCQSSRKMPSFCPNCNSNKIRAIGMPGSQKIADHLEKFFQGADIRPTIKILDNDTAKTMKEEKEILQDVSQGPSILIASQMIFSHRYEERFDLAAIPTVDGLLTMPDFRAEEKLIYQIQKLYDLKPEQIIIQSYKPESSIFSYIINNNWQEFFDKELILRKTFNYPPYRRLAKLTFKNRDGKKAYIAARTAAEKLRMVISQLQFSKEVELLGPSSAFIEKEKGLYIHNLILKIHPDFKIEKILKFVPPYWLIELDPKSII